MLANDDDDRHHISQLAIGQPWSSAAATAAVDRIGQTPHSLLSMLAKIIIDISNNRHTTFTAAETDPTLKSKQVTTITTNTFVVFSVILILFSISYR